MLYEAGPPSPFDPAALFFGLVVPFGVFAFCAVAWWIALPLLGVPRGGPLALCGVGFTAFAVTVPEPRDLLGVLAVAAVLRLAPDSFWGSTPRGRLWGRWFTAAVSVWTLLTQSPVFGDCVYAARVLAWQAMGAPLAGTPLDGCSAPSPDAPMLGAFAFPALFCLATAACSWRLISAVRCIHGPNKTVSSLARKAWRWLTYSEPLWLLDDRLDS